MTGVPNNPTRMSSLLWLYGIALAFIIIFVTVTIAIVVYDVARHDISVRDRDHIKRRQLQIIETQERLIAEIEKIERAISEAKAK